MSNPNPAPLKSYYKGEIARLYEVSMDQLDTWNKMYEKDLKKLGYKRTQKRYTIAQVEFLFTQLGRPS